MERRNVLLLGADLTLFMMALGLVGPLTLVPLFVSKLTDNPLAIGGLTAVFQLGWLPQIVAAGAYEQSSRKRTWLIFFGGLERLPALGLALCALAAPYISAPLLLGLVYLSRFSQTLFGGPAATAWLDYVARAVPPARRGSFMGVFTTVGNLAGAGLAAAAAPLLENPGYPLGFAACFAIGFLILVAGFLPLFLVVDPPGPPPAADRPLGARLRALPGVLAADRPFRRFLLGLALASLGAMGAAFLTVYGATQLGASDEMAAWYTVVLLASTVIGNLALGWLADRAGFSAVGLVSAVAGGCMALVGLAAPDSGWLLAGFALLGIGQAGIMLARLAGPMSFAPPERRPTYIALASALISLVSAVAPLLGGQVISLFGYGWLFGLSVALSALAAVVLGPWRLGRQPVLEPD